MRQQTRWLYNHSVAKYRTKFTDFLDILPPMLEEPWRLN